MRHNSHIGEYDYYEVKEDAPLLEWLLANVKGSKNKIKDILQGRGVKVNGKIITQFDFPLKSGMKVSISKTKRNDQLKSRYMKIVYEDRFLVVIEKNIG